MESNKAVAMWMALIALDAITRVKISNEIFIQIWQRSREICFSVLLPIRDRVVVLSLLCTNHYKSHCYHAQITTNYNRIHEKYFILRILFMVWKFC